MTAIAEHIFCRRTTAQPGVAVAQRAVAPGQRASAVGGRFLRRTPRETHCERAAARGCNEKSARVIHRCSPGRGPHEREADAPCVAPSPPGFFHSPQPCGVGEYSRLIPRSRASVQTQSRMNRARPGNRVLPGGNLGAGSKDGLWCEIPRPGAAAHKIRALAEFFPLEPRYILRYNRYLASFPHLAQSML